MRTFVIGRLQYVKTRISLGNKCKDFFIYPIMNGFSICVYFVISML